MSVKCLSIGRAVAAAALAASLSIAPAQAKPADTTRTIYVAHKFVSANVPLFLVLGVGY